WMYLVALNLKILNMTGSPAAVAGLFIIRPIAVLLTNTWSGSVIDRINKRRLLVLTDIVRGFLVFCIPFLESLWLIYIILLIINVFGAFSAQLQPCISPSWSPVNNENNSTP